MSNDICPWCKDPRSGPLVMTSILVASEGGPRQIDVEMHEKCAEALWGRIVKLVGVKTD